MADSRQVRAETFPCGEQGRAQGQGIVPTHPGWRHQGRAGRADAGLQDGRSTVSRAAVETRHASPSLPALSGQSPGRFTRPIIFHEAPIGGMILPAAGRSG
jgi:hypothetical protein